MFTIPPMAEAAIIHAGIGTMISARPIASAATPSPTYSCPRFVSLTGWRTALRNCFFPLAGSGRWKTGCLAISGTLTASGTAVKSLPRVTL